MWTAFVTIYRPEGTVLVGADGRTAVNLPMIFDRSSPTMIAQAQQVYGANARYEWKIITPALYVASLVKEEDVLIDQFNLDPDTGQLYKYKVVTRPKQYNDHQEFLCDTPIGT